MSVIQAILGVSSTIKSNRSVGSIFVHLESEVHELYDEIWDGFGDDQTNPGEDGVLGEAVDVMLCAVDIMYKDNPNITEADILKVVQRKLDKWQNVYGERN